MKTHLLLFAVLMFASPVMYAQNTIEAYNTGVLAGRSSTPMIADGIGEGARFESITAIWGDGSNLYVADSIAVRRIELNTARVTTLSRTAGSGINRIGGNSGFSYNYRGLYGLWGDGVSLYGADVGAGSVRKIDLTTGGVQTIAQGLGLAWGLSGRGTILYVAAAQAGRVMQVNAATGGASELAVTGSGTPRQCFLGSGCIGYFVPGPRSAWNDGQYLYLTGYSGTVKRLDLASGEQTFLPEAPFNIGPITGASGRLFVAATTSPQLSSVRLDTGEFTPIVLPADNLSISAMWSDGVGLYVAQGPYLRAQVIRRVDLATGAVTVVAGVAQVPEFATGIGTAARFHNPKGVWGDGDTLYVADHDNFSIRRIDALTGAVTPLAGDPGRSALQDGIGTNAGFIAPVGLWGDGATLYVTDAHSIRSIALSTAEVTTIAGTGAVSGASDGIGTAAQFANPSGLWGRNGILYIADRSNGVIRQLNIASQEVTTLAGAFGAFGTIDGPLESARFRFPTALWGDGATLYVGDLNLIRAISLDTGMVRTVASAPAVGTVYGLWGNGNSLYTFAVTGSPIAHLYLYRIGIATGEISEVVHGAGDPDTGLPIFFAGAGGIWGNNGNLFVTDDSDNTLRRLTPDSPPPLTRVEITNPGYSSRTTTGAPVIVSAGYARITASPGSVTPAGFAVFALRQNGVLISEASVPATHPIRSGRISASAAGVVNTGIAIANPDSASATIAFYFTDATGRNYRDGSFMLAGGAQLSRFLTEEPFNGPAPIDGTFTFLSSIPVSAVALRGYINERSEFLMTTMPVVDLSRQSTAPVTVTHFAAGGGWITELVLVNPSDQPISGSMRLLGATGAGASTSSYAIPGRSSQQVRFEAGADIITTGAIRVIPQTGAAPSAVCIFSFVRNEVRVSEASVPDVPVASAFHLYAETAGNFFNGSPGSVRSGLAVTNTSATPVDVTVETTDPQRNPGLGGVGTLHVDAMAHVSVFLDEIPGLVPFGARFFRISSATPSISVVGLRGRYNERGDFLITTTPAIPEDTTPDIQPLLFAHIVNGGGYTTQFVTFGATAQSIGTGLSVTTEYFNQTGAPMVLAIR